MNSGMTRLARALIIVVAVAASILVIYLKNPPILGLDLRGGVRLLLEADFSRESMTASERDSAVDNILETIRFRVNASCLTETTVTRLGDNRVSVEIPCVDPETCDDPEELRNLIERRGFLEFKKVLRQVNPDTATVGSNEQLIFDDEGNAYIVEARPLMTGAAIQNAFSQVSTSVALATRGRF